MPVKKSFGQHFLKDHTVIQKIIQAAEISPEDTVVEVGPGEGALTEMLAQLPNRLVLVELDRDLIPALQEKYPEAEIVQDDAAQTSYVLLVGNEKPWVFVSNLPYNAGNAILMHVLEMTPRPRRLVVMLQKEVAERILGAEERDRGILTVAVQCYAQVKRVCTVPPGAFAPPPKVDSVVLALTPQVEADESDFLQKVIAMAKMGFAGRRKQLHRTLHEAGFGESAEIKNALSEMGLSSTARPQELSLIHWKKLTQILRVA